jgi:hypothetical protein
MKSALDMMKAIKDYEDKKRLKEKQIQQDIFDARRGIVKMSLWEKYITLPKFKRQLQQECNNPSEYDGVYRVYCFTCGINSRTWSLHWLSYGAFLLEQLGYINVEVPFDTISEHHYITAQLPKTTAERILYG